VHEEGLNAQSRRDGPRLLIGLKPKANLLGTDRLSDVDTQVAERNGRKDDR
jgi:hypothetical protein